MERRRPCGPPRYDLHRLQRRGSTACWRPEGGSSCCWRSRPTSRKPARRADLSVPPRRRAGWRLVFLSCSPLKHGRTAVRLIRWFPAAVAALLLYGGSAALADGGKKPAREDSSFGALRSPDPAEVRKQAEAWLKSATANAATLAEFKTL